jgi:hypothetical protein
MSCGDASDNESDFQLDDGAVGGVGRPGGGDSDGMEGLGAGRVAGSARVDLLGFADTAWVACSEVPDLGLVGSAWVALARCSSGPAWVGFGERCQCKGVVQCCSKCTTIGSRDQLQYDNS